ncbi:MAG: glycosyltransferase, partial [Coriobacteriia bacterium]|nr:glycosyltransferase [Coriobacteriia bacterium]
MSETAGVDLSVVVVTWNNASEIGDCIRSLTKRMRQEGVRGEILVVDNASSDTTCDI